MKKNNRSNLTFQNIVSSFSIIIGINCFLSYRWFDGFLRINGIDSLAIITPEDLTFLFAKYNILIFKMGVIGFIGIFLVNLKSPYIHNLIENRVENVIERFKRIKVDFKKDKLIQVGLPLLVVLIIIPIFYFRIYKPILEFPSPLLLVSYLFILTVTPLVYYLKPNKRRLIFFIQIILLFIWANFFINYVLEESSKSKVDKLIAISFNYDNKKVQTNDTLSFVFQSYKYTILKGSVSYYFYNNSDIKNLKYTETLANVKLQSASTHKEKI
jgi:hypothetical protein